MAKKAKENGYLVAVLDEASMTVKTFVESIKVSNFGSYSQASIKFSNRHPHPMLKHEAEDFLAACVEADDIKRIPRKFVVIEVSFTITDSAISSFEATYDCLTD